MSMMKLSIKDFAPSWFASIRGTGVVAAVSTAFSTYIPILSILGKILAICNVGLFFILLIP